MKNITFLIVNISTSLSSLYFYLLMTKELSQITGEETFYQSLGLGLYLLLMGAGAYFIRPKELYQDKIKQLIKLEWGTLFTGATAPIMLYLYLYIVTAKGFYAPVSPQDISFIPTAIIGLIAVSFIGLFTGAQLPIFLKIGSENKNVILFSNYFGALLAGPILNHLIGLQVNLSGLIFFGIFISLSTLFGYLYLSRKFSKIWITILPIILLFFVGNYTVPLVKSFLGAYYFGLKVNHWHELKDFNKTVNSVGEITTIKSPYQDIHLVREKPLKNSLSPGNFTLYLNHKPQFDFMSSPTYHESMLFGALNLSQTLPKKVLILGGGDGILLSYILRNFPSTDVTLVELDFEVLNISKEVPALIYLNQGVLNQKDKYNLITEDGFNYIRKSSAVFDAIFIDFPYPYSDELLSLYSQEFYQVVHRRLAKDGFIVMDFPLTDKLQGEASPLAHRVTKTLHKSGFKSLLPFGPYSSFIYGEVNQRELKFHYDKMNPNLKLSTTLNLVSLKHLFKPLEKTLKPISLFYGQ